MKKGQKQNFMVTSAATGTAVVKGASLSLIFGIAGLVGLGLGLGFAAYHFYSTNIIVERIEGGTDAGNIIVMPFNVFFYFIK